MIEPDPRREDLLSSLWRQADAYEQKTLMTFGDGRSMTFTQFERRVGALTASETPCATVRRSCSLLSPTQLAWLTTVFREEPRNPCQMWSRGLCAQNFSRSEESPS